MRKFKAVLAALTVLLMTAAMTSCGKGSEGEGKATQTGDSTSATTLGTTASAETTQPKGELVETQVFLDTEFKEGFRVRGTQHGQGFVGKVFPDGKEKSADKWYISQWFCKNNLVEGEYKFDEKGYEMKTESQYLKVEYGEGASSVLVQIDASKEYDEPRKDGEPWPHILVEQTNLNKRVGTLDKLDELVFSVNARVPVFEELMENPNVNMHACQAVMFLTIREIKTQDMYWFGIPFFDNRHEFSGEYFAKDGGKEDATGKLIYTVAQKEFTDKSLHGGEWVTYNKNILPYIEKGLTRGKAAGYFDEADLSKYTIDSMNIGLEMFGTYNLAFEFEDISLVAKAYKEEN